jgi:hypothetical protein
MKKISFILIALLLMSTTIFTSCKKKSDTTTPPTIQLVAGTGFISSDVTINFGIAIQFKIAAVAGSGNLKHLNVQRASHGKTNTAFDTVFSSSSFNYIFHTLAAAYAGAETWTFTIYDENGNTALKSLVITTTPNITYGPVSPYSATLGSWQNISVGVAFASSNGLVYKMTNAKISDTLIDWLYYYLDATHPATITAPNDTAAINTIFVGGDGLFSWAHRNATVFKKVTDVINFGAIQNDSILIIETQSGLTASSISSLSVNDILAFKTDYGGKVGLIKIDAITPGVAGTITFDVVVQKTGK